jgi:hypothetical protein
VSVVVVAPDGQVLRHAAFMSNTQATRFLTLGT